MWPNWLNPMAGAESQRIGPFSNGFGSTLNQWVLLLRLMSTGRQSRARGNGLTVRMRKDLDLLHRRITVLKAVEEHEPIGIIRLSKRLGVPQHKVRYAFRVLEQDGLIRPSREGAVATNKAKPFHKKLRVVLNEMKETLETLTNSL